MSKQLWMEALVNSQIDGAAVTAAAATTLLPAAAKKTLMPNYFDTIGQMLLIKAHGRISSVITTPGTARFDFRLGGTVVFDGLAIPLDPVVAHTTVAWDLEIWLTLRAIGATANFMGYGRWTCEDIVGRPAGAAQGSLSAPLPWNVAPAVGGNFDSTASQQMDFQFTQTVATGSCTCHQYTVISMNY